MWTQRGYYGDHGIYWSSIAKRPISYPFGLIGTEGQMAVQVRQDTGEAVRWDAGNMPSAAVSTDAFLVGRERPARGAHRPSPCVAAALVGRPLAANPRAQPAGAAGAVPGVRV